MDIAKALNLIKRFEGLELQAYPDPATGGAPWTIGYGTTVYPSGEPVKPGDACTPQQAELWLELHVKRLVEPLKRLAPQATENEFNALLSFIYNVGLGNFKASTMLKLIKAGASPADIAAQFKRWNRAGGKIMAGLTRRREAESQLYMQKTGPLNPV
jgi:lysozyme